MTGPTTRRDILRRAPLVAAALIPVGVAAASQPSPMSVLFWKWWEAMIASHPDDDDESLRLLHVGLEIERQMLLIKPVTAEDLAMQIVVQTGAGDWPLEDNWEQERLYPLIPGLVGEDKRQAAIRAAIAANYTNGA